MSSIAPGDVLGDRFEVIGPIGRGGMATVYLAEDRLRRERVALKVLHPHLADDPTMRARLQREVRTSGLLKHSGALVAHDLHHADGRWMLSMPHHPGGSLAEQVRREGPLEQDALRDMGARLADVLAEAHALGIVHRDVTPGNVMLGEGGVVLTDFGLARLQRSGFSQTASVVMGTPGFAAPEIYQGARTDPRSDLYSLGAALYFAAAGRAPFQAPSPMGVLQKQLSGAFTPLADLRPDLSESLRRTIEALLAPEVQRRPQTAAEVRHALTDLADAAPTETTSLTWELPTGPAPAAGLEVSVPAPVVAGTISTPPAGTVRLDAGHHAVVVRRTRRADPQRLAASVAHISGDPTEVGSWSEEKRMVVVQRVSRDAAARIGEAARAAGYRAQLTDHAFTESIIGRTARLWWMWIPAIWVSFPFLIGLSEGIHVNGESIEDTIAMIVIPLCILATIILGVLGPKSMKRMVPEDLPLAFLRAGPARTAALPEPLTEAPPVLSPPVLEESPRESPLFRALAQLEGLRAAIGRAALPDVAASDLRATAVRLEQEARVLARQLERLDAAENEPQVEDAGWLQSRLDRLETMERAGEVIDGDERAQLRRAMAAFDAQIAEEAELESRRTRCMAQLLEIGASAARTRLQLLVPEPRSEALAVRLRQEADAATRAREELARAGLTREPAC